MLVADRPCCPIVGRAYGRLQYLEQTVDEHVEELLGHFRSAKRYGQVPNTPAATKTLQVQPGEQP